MNQQVYYKVCSISPDNKPISFHCHGNYTEDCVRYEIGKFVYPNKPSHYLAVFNDLELTKKFYRQNINQGEYKVFECEIDDICANPTYFKEEIDVWWPQGTVFAKAVKINKEVDMEERTGIYFVNLETGNLTYNPETSAGCFGYSGNKIIDGKITFWNTYHLNKITHLSSRWYTTLDKEFAEFLSKTIKKGLS